MGRAWRIEFEGALYHILSRGNEGRDIFSGDDDRRLFLRTLGEMTERFHVDLFAYVLMGNHYHILLRTQDANLSRAMQWFGVTYTNRFNLRNARIGHLFQGRFKSMLVENDAYLMQLSCYIHRNPLRAGIVERLADYRWSSYRAYAYGEKAPGWLKTELLLSRFQNAEDRNEAFRQEVQRYSKEENRLWEDLRHGFILGTERFVEAVKAHFLPDTPNKEIPQQRQVSKDMDTDRILVKASSLLGCNVEDFKKCAKVAPDRVLNRDLLLYILWQLGVQTNSQIGDLFGLTGSSVSRRVTVLKSKAANDDAIRQKIMDLKSIIKI